jgi:hypothetical protein
MNLEQLLGQAMGQRAQDWDSSGPLVDFDSGVDNIKVYLEQ